MPSPQLKFDLDARLVEQRERHLGVLVPIPLSERVDALAELLYDEGYGRVARKEVVAALLFAATEDAHELASLLAQYRRARVRDVLLGESTDLENVVSFPQRRPGPRNRSAGGSTS
jgi:hypothetical protein